MPIKVGEHFGKLTVIRETSERRHGYVVWRANCECGNKIRIMSAGLKRAKSCGCSQTKHGMHGTRVYRSWHMMLQRCLNPKYDGYENYGGRDITVVKRWLKFENFYADMGDRPEGMTLERKENNHGYSKSNCVWATRRTQNNNTRHNVLLTHRGKTRTVAQWSRKLGVPWNLLYGRVRSGNPVFAGLL